MSIALLRVARDKSQPLRSTFERIALLHFIDSKSAASPDPRPPTMVSMFVTFVLMPSTEVCVALLLTFASKFVSTVDFIPVTFV